MARKTKKGLGYFPLDVDFFEDDKIELINAEFGMKGECVTLRLLCLIYKNGYWYRFGEDESLLLAKRVGNGITGASVWEIVKGLVKRSFFDERVFNSFQILTSKGIQERYFEATERRKSIDVVPKIMLISLNDDILKKNVNILELNADISTQSKVKESKGEESKVKESKSHCGVRRGKTAFWQKLVDTWFSFYLKKFSSKPTFQDAAAKNLKSIAGRLEHLAVENRHVWTEDYAEKCLTHFLTRAYEDEWLQANFLLNNLATKFDVIVNQSKNGNHKTGKQPTGGSVDTESAFSKINSMPG